ncbi:DUF6585 family protein [Actinokineospora sp. HUAS TT18]|uniref:DUF6585 family protein n=1 Tax=Actinokineospora sp. HUAS TT18 TaxID=3447451 RepID=UPI003F52214A
MDPLLTQVDDAAARAGLGARTAFFAGAQGQPGSPGCMIVGALVLGGIGVALLSSEAAPMAWIPFGLLLLMPLGQWIEKRTTRRNQGMRLDLREHGLTVAQQGRVHVIRYDRTTILQRTVRHTGVAGYTTFEYTLTDLAGEKVVLRGRNDGSGEVAEVGRFSEPKKWGPAIQQAVTDAQLPAAISTLNAGQRVDFGGMWLTRDEVGSRKDSARWSQVEEVKVWDGLVRFKVAGQRRAVTAAVSAIPNYFIFITLAEHLRAAAR